MRLYKLTDEKDQTYNRCQWGEDITIETSGKGDLCGPGFTHWYLHPLLAVFLNPIHGGFNLETAHLWEGEGEIVKSDHDLKVGCKKATTRKRVTLPKVTVNQSIAFGVLCAAKVYKDRSFLKWTEKWLNGEDRTGEAAVAFDVDVEIVHQGHLDGFALGKVELSVL